MDYCFPVCGPDLVSSNLSVYYQFVSVPPLVFYALSSMFYIATVSALNLLIKLYFSFSQTL